MEILSNLGNSFVSQISPLPIILITITTLFLVYVKFQLNPLQSKKLPPGSLGFPFVGESLSFLKAQKQDKTNEWFADRVAKHGPVFKTSLFGSKAVAITGQAGNKFMFSGADNGIASNLVASSVSIIGKHSIFEVSGARHKLVRGAMMTFLKPESLQKFVGQMDSLVKQQLFHELNGQDSVKVVNLMKKTTFKVTCSLLFGLPEGMEKNSLFEDFTAALKATWAIPLDFPGTIFSKGLQARRRICDFLSKLISQRKMELEEGKVGPQDDVISTFISLRDENGEPLPEEEIIDNMITLIIASHDTTTILLTMFVRHLARDAEVRSKVFEEQKEAMKGRELGDDGMLGWSEIQSMKYTWRVAQEIMRITPPVFGNFKSTFRDTSFANFHIPKGWQVFWVASPTHMDMKYFDKPQKFDPSRFENSIGSIPSYVYIPFGAGPRICPGSEFAKIEVLLIIHHLITKYQWTEMIRNEPITRDPMPYPAMGLPIKLHLREN